MPQDSAWAKAPALNDRSSARGHRRVPAVSEHCPQRELDPIAAIPAAIAETTKRRLETAVICRRNDVLEFDVITHPASLPQRDQPAELVEHDPEGLWPMGRCPSWGDMVREAKRRWVGSIRLCGGSRAHEGAQPDAIQRLST